jgi:outer membrane protein OmpA-like peptidoglycan-associated protein
VACGAQQPVEPGIDDPVIEVPVPSDLPNAAPIDGCRTPDGTVVGHGASYKDRCNTCECTPTGPMCTKMRCPDQASAPVIRFSPGSAVPGPEAMMTLGNAASAAMQAKGLVVVVGRATSAEYRADDELPRRRAISMAARLRALGVPKDRLRITTDGTDEAAAFIRINP